MPVTSMTIRYSRPRRKPQVGDTKMIKGVLHVRQQAMADYFGKRSYLVRDGRPVFEWVKAP